MIKVDTTRFRNSHGRNPRGTGHWIFQARDVATTFEFTGTYTEAKRALREDPANARLSREWFVAP